jgi:PIN domain nuclease of toxin-antitoxin system
MLLDTCALLWLAGEHSRLSSSALQQIDSEPIVSVSAISAFEIAVKTAKGKLGLPLPVEEWWKKTVLHHHLDVIQVSDDILIRSVSLPQIHSDPADRIIIATALLHNLPVVTADSRFTDYGVRVLL